MTQSSDVWVGKRIRIITSKNPSLIGLEGVMVDETQNMIKMETANGKRNVQKASCVLEVDGQRVEGSKVLFAPQDRMKLKVTK
ncbi:MAG TPA: ribonuclease P protein subunit [Candidatus Nanoarchaeia archaeon]|nr:ribonuclease P protein subunit [Candidatus Nanoarchaeia archaeon]